MKISKLVLWFSAIFMIALLISGCKNEQSSPTQPLQKNSNIILKIGSKNVAANTVTSNGEVQLSSFKINLSKVTLQENSGFDGEQQGDNNDGENETGGRETETPDIVLNGPLSFEIASGSVQIGNIDVYPGVFKKVDLSFTPSTNSPFDNNSIIVVGNYRKQTGEVIPFTIRSKFSQTFETVIANGGITINSNSTVSVTILFNFETIFNNVNFSSAVITNGQIVIDEQNNMTLLQAFEKNLNNSIEVEEH